MEELEKIAVVNLLQHRSIISLIGNVQRSSLILEKVSLSSCMELLKTTSLSLLYLDEGFSEEFVGVKQSIGISSRIWESYFMVPNLRGWKRIDKMKM